MLAGREISPPEKTLYWWSVHLDRFLNFCRRAGPESSAVPERVAQVFLASIRGKSDWQKFAAEQARMALDVFLAEIDNGRWGTDWFGRVDPVLRIKTAAAAEGAPVSGPPEGTEPDGDAGAPRECGHESAGFLSCPFVCHPATPSTFPAGGGCWPRDGWGAEKLRRVETTRPTG